MVTPLLALALISAGLVFALILERFRHSAKAKRRAQRYNFHLANQLAWDLARAAERAERAESAE